MQMWRKGRTENRMADRVKVRRSDAIVFLSTPAWCISKRKDKNFYIDLIVLLLKYFTT